ncbi:MAG: 1,4-alpha-glucan branching protein GlgB [Ruminococcus sp.]|uniref:1,4-alpha-glucan branching enzyme GlgB n=1 Tax=Schaedlerella arabinosiphila TaxID=2044587 RepID=A0A426DKF2_9FIRM|nr:1,4-alpha-glucan branching protein GlgB [Schaedlerella arabinosiphila]MCI8723460.1 1,4-alpha-glucan branching protein GlgB [Ruminococcus sp.]MCI9212301.1 1,4-alpha-glucan branching protein GlgB [Ruminococcus sp.]RRK33278.1 1,4-alpha-glucan branching protein GlgB [Schaedlerella arabinosiphila]
MKKNDTSKTTAASKEAKTVKPKKAAQPYEIGELDQYLFGHGTHYEIYKKMGAHKVTVDGVEGVYFAVWAPHAEKVSVVGEFNGWEADADEMERLEPAGIYTRFVPGAKEGDMYKFCIETMKGEKLYKADPFANYSELRPGNASRVADISHFTWSDDAWMEAREKWDNTKNPMSVYEVHMGSWMRHPCREDEGFYTYRDFAVSVTEYVKKMGYTHVELMGIAEHPFDGSWGYQVTGYYAPTSRYGTPEDFAYLVNYLHKNKIGVILDWVPAHFPRDAHGLADFDGTPTFEYADPRRGEHPDWGTKIFDLGKSEVENFLIANALFWIEHYHVDGLRVDAVASMLYLDYGKQDGQWVANKYGGNENLEAIEFFKHLNSVVLGRNHGAVMIAEESTAWPKVTGAPEEDGLGFSIKWNMGWMHDFTEYMKLDPLFRKNAHYMMTFSMEYAYSENYILVLSHDEVVHLKCSMLNKMPGLGFDKFANLKAAYAFMIGHPGKKLLFMGQDFAQLREWSEERELDWFLLAEQPHQQIQNWVQELLHLYRKNKALYEMDTDEKGFEWINKDDIFRSIFSFVRYSKDRKRNLLFVCNFTPMEREDYRVGVPRGKQYKLILNSDDERYGGTGGERPLMYKAVKKECDGQKYSFAYPLPPYGVAVFEF